MRHIIGIGPLLLFVLLFVGTGVYFTINDVQNAFYQFPPVIAVIPAISLAWFLHGGKTSQRMSDFLDGVRHPDVITMCIIFLLAGAFSEVTKHIGSINATVNMALTFIPSNFILLGIFFIAAFISTSIGTSMGTIATVAPLASALAGEAYLDQSLMAATVVGGAMFGDNLSIVSDTTIAAVTSQEANLKKKLIINVKVAILSCIVTVLILLMCLGDPAEIAPKDFSFVLITPYIFLIVLASLGVNVFVSLVCSIVYACLIALIDYESFSIIQLSKTINTGFSSMFDIMLLSMLIGGLSGLSGKKFAKDLAASISLWIDKFSNSPKIGQLVIAKLVSVFDLLLANNTIAIIFSGEIAREIAKKQKIPAHYSAVWLDIFSCVFQGLIPYGAQILLASATAGVSPLSIVPHVYYCYTLGIVSIIYILLNKRLLV